MERLGDGGRPEAPSAERVVRADLLRALIVGGEGIPRMHEKGMRLAGALVTGPLDLEGCRISRGLSVVDCTFESAVVLRGAVIDTLILDGSALPALLAERLETRGDVALRSATAGGIVALGGARIGGSLIADGLTIHDPMDTALDAEAIETRGSIFLRGARLEGRLLLSNATVAGDIEAIGLEVRREGTVAVDGHGLTVAGNLLLRRAAIAGETVLDAASVGGDLDVSGAAFRAGDGVAFRLARGRVDGALVIREGAAFEGLLGFNGSTAALLVDDPASWPAAGNLSLNRFLYGAFLASPVDARTRLRWLALQDPTRSGEDFWPQPYECLADVLSGMGHDEDARAVLFEKERLQRRARRARAATPFARALLEVRDLVLFVTVGYGRKAHLAFLWLALLWVCGALLLAAAEAREAIRPNVAVVLRSPEWVLCGYPAGAAVELASIGVVRTGLAEPGESQLACWRRQPEAATYPRFNRWMYAVDAMLPALDSGQRDYWSADTRTSFGAFVKGFTYLLTIAGWALSLLAVAAFSGIVRSR
jgi:hypothetical protein